MGLADRVFGFALLGGVVGVAGLCFTRLRFSRLASLEPPLGSRDLFAQARRLDEEVVHGMAVIAIGFRVGKAAFELRSKILRALLQMFEVTAVHSVLRSTRHKIASFGVEFGRAAASQRPGLSSRL